MQHLRRSGDLKEATSSPSVNGKTLTHEICLDLICWPFILFSFNIQKSKLHRNLIQKGACLCWMHNPKAAPGAANQETCEGNWKLISLEHRPSTIPTITARAMRRNALLKQHNNRRVHLSEKKPWKWDLWLGDRMLTFLRRHENTK